jgi:hypothetical protein
MAKQWHNIKNWSQAQSDSYEQWKDETKDSIAAKVTQLFGRQKVLSKRHALQKQLFQKLFRKAYKEEQDELCKRKQHELRTQLEHEGLVKAHIDKQVKKVKLNPFDKEKATVEVGRFLKFVEQEIDNQIRKYTQYAEKKKALFARKDALQHKQDALLFVRHCERVSIFGTPFFQQKSTECKESITWCDFKTQVFYKFVDNLQEHSRIARQQIKIIERITQSFEQLHSENAHRKITYDILRKRLQTWAELFERNFFVMDCFIARGDEEVTLAHFLEKDCHFHNSVADLHKLVTDLEEEHRHCLEPQELQLAHTAFVERKEAKTKVKEQRNKTHLEKVTAALLKHSSPSPDQHNHNNSGERKAAADAVSGVSSASQDEFLVDDSLNSSEEEEEETDFDEDDDGSEQHSDTDVDIATEITSAKSTLTTPIIIIASPNVNNNNEDADSLLPPPPPPAQPATVAALTVVIPLAAASDSTNPTSAQLTLTPPPPAPASPLPSETGFGTVVVTMPTSTTTTPSNNNTTQAATGQRSTTVTHSHTNDDDDSVKETEKEVEAVEIESVKEDDAELNDDKAEKENDHHKDDKDDQEEEEDEHTEPENHETEPHDPLDNDEKELTVPESKADQEDWIHQFLNKCASASAVLDSIQNTLATLEDKGSQALEFLKSLYIRAQVATSTQLHQLNQNVKDTENKMSRNRSAVFISAGTRERNRQLLEEQLFKARQERDLFCEHSQQLLQHVKEQYRVALHQSRDNHETDHTDVAKHGFSWKQFLSFKKQPPQLQEQEQETKTAAATVILGAAAVQHKHPVLTVALESGEAFAEKFSKFIDSHCSTSLAAELPSAIDYSSELHEVVEQPRQYPGFVYALSLIKEWQEFKSCALTERLSTEFLIDQLHIQTGKAATAVNAIVPLSIIDALTVLQKIGIPRESVYHQHKESALSSSSSSKQHKHTNEEVARLHARSTEHAIDKVCLVKDIEQLRIALFHYGPVAVNFPVYNSKTEFFWHHNNDKNNNSSGTSSNRAEKSKESKPISSPAAPSPSKCAPPRHTMVIVGYDDATETVLIRNSEGKRYGNFGSIRVCYTDLFGSKEHFVFLLLDHTQPRRKHQHQHHHHHQQHKPNAKPLNCSTSPALSHHQNHHQKFSHHENCTDKHNGKGSKQQYMAGYDNEEDENPSLILNHPKLQHASLEEKVRDARHRIHRFENFVQSTCHRRHEYWESRQHREENSECNTNNNDNHNTSTECDSTNRDEEEERVCEALIEQVSSTHHVLVKRLAIEFPEHITCPDWSEQDILTLNPKLRAQFDDHRGQQQCTFLATRIASEHCSSSKTNDATQHSHNPFDSHLEQYAVVVQHVAAVYESSRGEHYVLELQNTGSVHWTAPVNTNANTNHQQQSFPVHLRLVVHTPHGSQKCSIENTKVAAHASVHGLLLREADV